MGLHTLVKVEGSGGKRLVLSCMRDLIQRLSIFGSQWNFIPGIQRAVEIALNKYLDLYCAKI